jgi:RNA polymerase-binding transcription factor DksA
MGAATDTVPLEETMTDKKLDKLKNRLREMAARLVGDTTALEDSARTSTGGDVAGNLSNAPMHLADLGTEVYMQELNSTLLQNQEHLRDEVIGALKRIEAGTYGQCESCEQRILESRLEVLPFARYCTACAEAEQSGVNININHGRLQDEASQARRGRLQDPDLDEVDLEQDEMQIPFTDLEADHAEGDRADVHAAGSPGGGTAIGGLAGTNTGGGEPDDAELDSAMGSGNFDVNINSDQELAPAYAGPTGGAVGGTPAGKRATGG